MLGKVKRVVGGRKSDGVMEWSSISNRLLVTQCLYNMSKHIKIPD